MGSIQRTSCVALPPCSQTCLNGTLGQAQLHKSLEGACALLLLMQRFRIRLVYQATNRFSTLQFLQQNSAITQAKPFLQGWHSV